MRLDHVIYGTTNLDAAAARIEASLGLAVQPGGRHVGQGSHNRIVPLGPGYLELLAIADAEEAAGSEIGQILLEVVRGDGLIAWAVRRPTCTPSAARLGTTVYPVHRDGMTAYVTGVVEALREPQLPFFVQADARAPHPGEGGEAGGLTWIEVAGDEARLREWLGGADAAGPRRGRRARACARSASASASFALGELRGRLALRELLAQRLLGELADRGLRDLVDDLHVVRKPPLRHVLGEVLRAAPRA